MLNLTPLPKFTTDGIDRPALFYIRLFNQQWQNAFGVVFRPGPRTAPREQGISSAIAPFKKENHGKDQFEIGLRQSGSHTFKDFKPILAY
jgi:hypothetical protein